MLALSEIIDFLLNLMRDENARAEFEQDPQGALARAGLEGATGQDISDARLVLADSGAVRASAEDGSGASSAGGPSVSDDTDPVRQINYTTQHYEAEPAAPAEAGGGGPELNLLQQSSSNVSIDERSFFFQTFNSDDDVTIIDDSFNAIDNSSTDVTVTNIDAENSFNDGSFNSDDDVTAIQADNSFNTNEDNDVVAIQDNDTVNQDTDVLAIDADNSFNETEAPAPAAPAAEDAPVDEPPVDEPVVEEPVVEDPTDDAADPGPGDAADVVPI